MEGAGKQDHPQDLLDDLQTEKKIGPTLGFQYIQIDYMEWIQ